MNDTNGIKTVTIYESWVKVADILTDEQKGQFYHAIIRYALYGEEPELAAPMDAFFTLIKPSVDKSNARKTAGSNGGKNKQNSSKTQAKRKQNSSKNEVCLNEDDKQNASKQVSKEKEKVKEKEKEKVKENIHTLTSVIACECEAIAKIYPKEKIGDFRQVVEAVSRAVQREIDRGSSEADAIALVKVGTIAYAGVAKRMKHKRYIIQPVKFFDNGIYNNDPETWEEVPEENNKGGKSAAYDWRNPDTWGDEGK